MARGLRQRFIGGPLASGTMDYSLNAPLSGGGISPLGSLFSGLVQGFLGQQQLAKQQEQTQLQHELGKSRIKLMQEQLKYQELSNKLIQPFVDQAGQGQEPGAAGSATPLRANQETNRPEPNNPPEVPGMAPIGPGEMFYPENGPPTTIDPHIAEQQAQVTPSLKSKMTGPGGLPLAGVTLGKSAPSIRFGEERQPMSADNQLWAQLLKDNNGDYVKAREEYNKQITGTSTARAQGPYNAMASEPNQAAKANMNMAGAAGTTQGHLNIERTPEFQGNITNKEESRQAGRPLEASAQTAVNAMGDAVLVAKELKTKFTPEERAKYVGILRFPATRIAQFVNNDPKFAEFQALVNRAKSSAFGEGGKQLTPFEASVVFGYVPTGTEFSSADFEAKLNNSLDRAQSLIDRRIKLGTTPRRKVNPADISGGPTLAPGAPAGTPKTAADWLRGLSQ